MNIIKKQIFIVLLIAGSYICSAQEISIQGGFNLSKFNYKNEGEVVRKDGEKLNLGFNVGPMLEFPLKNMFSLETGILFTKKGNRISGNPLQGVNNYLFQINTFYLDFPIMLKATIPIKKIKCFAMAGGYAGSALYGRVIAEGEENSELIQIENKIHWGNEQNEYDRLDYGLKFGAGIKILRYQIGACYDLGLKNFSNSRFEMRNRIWEFYVAYTFKELNKNEK